MLSSLIIVLREILEASLVIGVLLAATRGLRRRGRFVFIGCTLGAAGAGVVAVFTEVISNAIQGVGQEIFNATVLFLAALMIGWHVVWMKRHASEMTQELKTVGQEVCEGRAPLYALSAVAFLAVLREGSEIVLFLYGLLASGQPLSGVLTGGLLGLLAGSLMGALLYLGLVRIPAGSLFSVTGSILIFLASGMVAHGVGYLSAIGWLPTLADPLWDTSSFLSEQNIFGKILNALIGYTERPTGLQVLFYALTAGGMMMLLKVFRNSKASKKMAVLLVITAGVFGLGGQAHAFKKVDAPLIVEHELEIEFGGTYDFDHRDEQDNHQKNNIAVGYGVTPWWFTEVGGEWENHPLSLEEQEAGEEKKGFEYEATEWENRFQLSEPGDWFIDTGFLAAYGFASKNEEADHLELKLLLEKDIDSWRHRANLILEKAFGGDSEEKWEGGASWSTTYRFRQQFEPGFEVYWDYGEFNGSRTFDEQNLQVGPAAYGKISRHVKYDVGYLFGATQAAPDKELKAIIELEWIF